MVAAPAAPLGFMEFHGICRTPRSLAENTGGTDSSSATMQDIHPLGNFIVAIVIFQLIPGPGTLSILRATADHGLKAGFASVAGTLLGGLLCMLAAASGLEAVLRGRPEMTQLIQWAGSLYLAWMGWRLLSVARGASNAGPEAAPALGQHLRRALAVSLTNPKVILFYFALFPLFMSAPDTAGNSLATMIACVTGISFVY
ncbi:MAG: LysE family translocator, partial [Solirubrobacteraceae bacterium]|nr:LysE family translocator [Solirubrobacteraceae bacterium]